VAISPPLAQKREASIPSHLVWSVAYVVVPIDQIEATASNLRNNRHVVALRPDPKSRSVKIQHAHLCTASADKHIQRAVQGIASHLLLHQG